MKLTPQEVDVCRNLKDSLDLAASGSKRMLGIITWLYEIGAIDAVAPYAQLTAAGRAALAEQKDRTNG